MNKELLKLAIPNILTNLTVPLVSMVDIGLMGRMPSSSYIIAIGFGTLIFNFIYWAFGFLRMGTTGMVSQAYGRDDTNDIRKLLVRGIIIALVAGILMILLKESIRSLSLVIINPNQAVIIPLGSYFDIRIFAAPATISIYVIVGWLLGMQDAKSALFLAVLINGINAVLSFSLVHYLNLGIEGVAIGTVVAQYCGLFAGLLFLWRKHRIRLNDFSYQMIFPLKGWKSFLTVNFDIFLRTLFLIFVMSFFKSKAGNIDPIVGAANILLLEFITISAYGIDGFAFAAESICGKYFGNMNREKFIHAVKLSMLWGIGLAAILSVLYLTFGREILLLLTNKLNIIEVALNYLPWLVVAPLVNAFAFIWDGIYVGTTTSKPMRNAMIMSTLFIFLPSFYLLRTHFGNHGIWMAFTLFMLSRGVIQSIMAKKYIFNRI